jgi:chemotaxis response regulator CheB
MPAVFTRLLAERLATRCPYPVVEATAGTPLGPRGAWIAPGDFHMTVARGPTGWSGWGSTSSRRRTRAGPRWT